MAKCRVQCIWVSTPQLRKRKWSENQHLENMRIMVIINSIWNWIWVLILKIYYKCIEKLKIKEVLCLRSHLLCCHWTTTSNSNRKKEINIARKWIREEIGEWLKSWKTCIYSGAWWLIHLAYIFKKTKQNTGSLFIICKSVHSMEFNSLFSLSDSSENKSCVDLD